MSARKIKCRVKQMKWLTPSVMELLFEPEKKFHYEPGQFVSLVIPKAQNLIVMPGNNKRMYSFASPLEEAKKEGYRLCVKFNPGGLGSVYISLLKPGDFIEVMAPYGDFIYETRELGRTVFFISTGTGIAPMRSMVLSNQIRSSHPKAIHFLYGCREEREILYPEITRHNEIQVHHAVSRPSPEWKGFKGRVTDFLASLPRDFEWHSTDFYLCGSPEMATDVTLLLTHTMGVSLNSIFQEVFAAPTASAQQIKEEIRRIAA